MATMNRPPEPRSYAGRAVGADLRPRHPLLLGLPGRRQVLLFDGGEKPHPTKPGETVHVWRLMVQERDPSRRPQARRTRVSGNGRSAPPRNPTSCSAGTASARTRRLSRLRTGCTRRRLAGLAVPPARERRPAGSCGRRRPVLRGRPGGHRPVTGRGWTARQPDETPVEELPLRGDHDQRAPVRERPDARRAEGDGRPRAAARSGGSAASRWRDVRFLVAGAAGSGACGERGDDRRPRLHARRGLRAAAGRRTATRSSRAGCWATPPTACSRAAG